MCRQMGRWDVLVGRWVDRWIGGRVGGWVDEWMTRQVNG